jgi:hypothetical protein
MNLKKLALWLVVIGLVALIVGAVIGALTFDIVAFKEKAAEKKGMFNDSYWDACEKNDTECWADLKDGCDDDCWAKKKKAWFWKEFFD